ADIALRVIVMDKGGIGEEWPPQTIFTNPQTARTRAFLTRLLYHSGKYDAECAMNPPITRAVDGRGHRRVVLGAGIGAVPLMARHRMRFRTAGGISSASSIGRRSDSAAPGAAGRFTAVSGWRGTAAL